MRNSSEACRTARRKAVAQAIGRQQSAAYVAVTILLHICADGLSPASVRLAAAAKILDLAIKAIEIEDLQQRLEVLERAYADETYD
jgi:hypothetical protein